LGDDQQKRRGRETDQSEGKVLKAGFCALASHQIQLNKVNHLIDNLRTVTQIDIEHEPPPFYCFSAWRILAAYSHSIVPGGFEVMS
jgi:hypothetical protein